MYGKLAGPKEYSFTPIRFSKRQMVSARQQLSHAGVKQPSMSVGRGVGAKCSQYSVSVSSFQLLSG